MKARTLIAVAIVASATVLGAAPAQALSFDETTPSARTNPGTIDDHTTPQGGGEWLCKYFRICK